MYRNIIILQNDYYNVRSEVKTRYGFSNSSVAAGGIGTGRLLLPALYDTNEFPAGGQKNITSKQNDKRKV